MSTKRTGLCKGNPEFFGLFHRSSTIIRFISLLFFGTLLALSPLEGAAEEPAAAYTAVPAGTGYWAAQQAEPTKEGEIPDWVNRLKAQILLEETMEGRSGRTSKIAKMHEKMMDHAIHAREGEVRKTSGPYSYSDLLHQFGMMGDDPILGPANPAASDAMNQGGRCPSFAPRKEYEIVAIEVGITLNQWQMFYYGYMFTLGQDLERVRAEEARNEEARTKDDDPGAVSNGLQGDAIQPLVIRGNAGDCMIFKVVNEIEEQPISFRIHGSNMVVQSSGEPAILTNPDATIYDGEGQTFEWYLRPDEQEGGHQIQSVGQREQTALGLIGTFVVEPAGSTYLSPWEEGKELKSGWQAIIAHPQKPDFREFVLIYHEVGDEAFRPVDRNGEMLPQRDPLSDAYRPGSRALNFRSEPFGIAMLQRQKDVFHFEDESSAYSSYTFGDAPTALARSYLGDPAKWRLVHGGSEVFHSHHPHGGTIRWLRQPMAGDKRMFADGTGGPVKFPVVRTISDRVDVQVIGPSEVFDLDVECGSGLCQHLAGDFLYHCHVAHHYVAGMWGYWRVYNTLQLGNYPHESTDIMRPLVELPDRKGLIKKAVTSDTLVGKSMNWFGKKYQVTKDKTDWLQDPPLVSVKDWVSYMVPTMGQRGHTNDEFKQVMAHDATVLPWTWDGSKAMNEPQTIFEWPKYKPAQGNHHDWTPAPGKRFPFLFEPKTGKVAWPHLHPHLGMRPLFPHNHNGAPWLEPFQIGADAGNRFSEPGQDAPAGKLSTKPATPGEHGPWSLCPENSGRAQFTVNFVEIVIEMTGKRGNQPAVVDPNGLLFVLAEEEAEVRTNKEMHVPLVMRANVYDCIDIVLKSKWKDNAATNLLGSKVNMHHHFHQFDNQASDGVISGMSYEQAARPYDMLVNDHPGHGLPLPMNDALAKPAKKGDTVLHVTGANAEHFFHKNIVFGVGMDQVDTFEIVRITDLDNKNFTITLEQGLKHDHAKGEFVSVEWVRERLYADAQYGNVFWHDHAFGATTWPHGAVGQIVVEPINSTYHSSVTGEEIRSGPIADIHTREPIGIGRNAGTLTGSFRELVLNIQDTLPYTAQIIYDGNPENFDPKKQIADLQTVSFMMPLDLRDSPFPRLNGGTHTTGGAFNMKAESLATRLANNSDASQLFSSKVHGDPETPLLRAYLGDPIMVRALDQTMNESHTWNVTGHYFRTEQHMAEAQPDNTLHIGIAERYNLLMAAGGPQKMAGDYLHYNGRVSKLGEGSWGLIRVLDEIQSNLKVLPGYEEIPKSATSVCPSDAPVKKFNVVAMDYAMRLHSQAPETITVDFDRKIQLANPEGKIYVLENEVQKVSSGNLRPHPLVLRVNVGDCMQVTLQNQMKKEKAGLRVDLLAMDPHESMGVDVGNNKGGQAIEPGGQKTYTYYAHPELGVNSALIRDWGNVLINPRDGLYGAVVVAPRGSKFRDPETGADLTMANAWQVDVIVDRSYPENAGRTNYRDAVLMFVDEDQIMGTSFMPYLQQTAGLTMVNYRLEPYAYRQDLGCDSSDLFYCEAASQDPETPVITTHAGDQVVIHIFGASSEQNGIFAIEGHEWPLEPFREGSDLLSAHQFGGAERSNIYITAGGAFALPGDYTWMNVRMPYMESGQWGFLRVLPAADKTITALHPVDDDTRFAETSHGVKPISLP